jgi:hypothetical protein
MDGHPLEIEVEPGGPANLAPSLVAYDAIYGKLRAGLAATS